MAAGLGTVEPNAQLFKDVVYYLNDSLAPAVRQSLDKLLSLNGGTPCPPNALSERFDIDKVTHVITDTLDFPEYAALRPDRPAVSKFGEAIARTNNSKGKEKAAATHEQDERVKIVLPIWVTRSFDLQRIKECKYFSPDKAMFFASLCFSTLDLAPEDNDAVRAAVTTLGGQYFSTVTREVTHVLAVAPQGVCSIFLAALLPRLTSVEQASYERLLKYGPQLGLSVVLPHWFEECLKLGQLVPIDIYQFPDPPLMTSLRDGVKSFDQRLTEFWTSKNLDKPKQGRPTASAELQNLLNTTAEIIGDDNANRLYKNKKYLDNHVADPTSSKADNVAQCTLQIFKGRTVYFASNLGVRPGLEAALKARIEEAGGKCWSWGVDTSDEANQGLNPEAEARRRRKAALGMLKQANTVITRARQGWEYWQAWDDNKTIANLAWLYHVLATKKLDAPTDRLMHYPLPTTAGLPAFTDKIITVSNYAGSARDYVRTMIESLGAKFDGTLTRTTSYVVTARQVPLRRMAQPKLITPALEYGEKVRHAKSWHIPLVSHLWLEACILDWSFIDPSSSSTYLADAASTTFFTSILGNTPLPRGALEKWSAKDENLAARIEALKDIAAESEDEDDGLLQVPLEAPEEVDAIDEGPVAPKDDGDDDDDEEPVTRPKSSPRKRTKRVLVSDDEEASETRSKSGSRPPPPKRKVSTKAESKSKASAAQELSPPTTDHNDKGGSKSQVKVVTVQVTTTTKYDSQRSGNGQTKTKAPSSNGGSSSPLSEQGSDNESSDKHETKLSDARKTKAAVTTPQKRSRIRKASSSDSSSSDEGPPSSTAITRAYTIIDAENIVVHGSRRAAAVLGAKKLANLMPDANKFAMEQKSSAVKKRKRTSTAHAGKRAHQDSDDDDDAATGDDEPAGTTRKGRPQALADKKRKPAEADDSENESVQDGAKSIKKPVSAPGKGRIAQVQQTGTTQHSVQVSSFDNPPRGKPPAKVSKKVMIMSTGTGLDAKSPDIKTLKSLGASWTDQPGQVTHLVVKQLSRTEKLLCCLAVAPFIVTTEWVDACIAAGRLVNEAPYVLKDEAKEKGLGDTLENILARARARRLFEGKTVYVTKGVEPEVSKIQKILQSGNATVNTSKITSAAQQSILRNEDTYVVSCLGDRQQWETLAEKGKPIYSVEAVFHSVMLQNMSGFDLPNARIDQQLHG
ncbi:regulator of Ty1 Transposition [Microbotryomycetes sp. JL201]|nr:regulator of Ty1 Transposition [Microbotryomycetes sp. JL201]